MLIRRAPGAPLAGRVTSYYGFEAETPEPVRQREGPGTDVVVILTFEEHWLIDGARHTSFVAGLHDRQVTTEHPGRSLGMQANLDPLAARALVGMPLHELAGLTVPAEEILDAFLVERLADTSGWDARFALLDAALAPRLADARGSCEVAWAWQRLRDTHGRVAIGELAAELGWSRKRIVARFRDEIGLPPKAVARLLRFEHARARRHDALGRARLRVRLLGPVAPDRRVPPDHRPDAGNISPRHGGAGGLACAPWNNEPLPAEPSSGSSPNRARR